MNRKSFLSAAAFTLAFAVLSVHANVKWNLSHDAQSLRFEAEAPKGSNVALFLDPEGHGTTVYRIVFSSDGKVCGTEARDDNTNRDIFTYRDTWRSQAKVSVAKKPSSWSLKATIPFGAFPKVGASAAKWGVMVSDLDVVTQPRKYEKREFAKMDRKAYSVDVLDFDVKIRKSEGQLCACASVPVRNRTGSPMGLRVRAMIEAIGGNREKVSADAETTVEAIPAKLIYPEVAVPCGKQSVGTTARMRLCVSTKDGMLLGESVKEFKIDYNPVVIRMTSPYYRDCVFETMKLSRLEGEVLLEEGLGRRMEVLLTGPGTREKVQISSAAATNRFAFSFAGKAKGDYFVTVGDVKKRIRNLPYRKGEVWIDRNRVVHRDGKRMFPFGWYSEMYTRRSPGVNIAQSYNIYMRNLDKLDWQTEEAVSNGCGLVISPMQELSKIPHKRLFGRDAAKGTFDGDGLGEERKRVLVEFARRARTLPGFFAYYLQDEPEGRDLSPDFFREVKKIVEEEDPYHPTIIVNYTIDGIRRFAASADILCPDTYPVYMVGGAPLGKLYNTYEWSRTASECGVSSMFSPQVFDWDYKVTSKRITRGPTYLELRAQSLLALVADVRGLMLYSRFSMNTPSEHLMMGPEFLAEEIGASQDVFLAPCEPVAVTAKPESCKVVAAVKRHGGRTALVAVNTTWKKARVVFSAPDLPSMLHTGDGKPPRRVVNGSFEDELGPHEAKVYHSVAGCFSVKAAAEKIDAAEARRRKDGNLAVAARFPTWVELLRMGKGELDIGYPKIVPTSTTEQRPKGLPRAYFLQDGFSDVFPYVAYHGWKPSRNDKSPAVRVEFGEPKRFRRVVVTCCRDREGRYAVSSGWVEVNGKKVAQFKRGKDGRAEAVFAPVVSGDVTVHVDGIHHEAVNSNWQRTVPWISEVEVY